MSTYQSISNPQKSLNFHCVFRYFRLSRFSSFPTLQDGARGPQDRPRAAQAAPKTAPGRPQDGPREPQDGPRGARLRPRLGREGPKRAPRAQHDRKSKLELPLLDPQNEQTHCVSPNKKLYKKYIYF